MVEGLNQWLSVGGHGQGWNRLMVKILIDGQLTFAVNE